MGRKTKGQTAEFLVETEIFAEDEGTEAGQSTTRAIFSTIENVAGYVRDIQKKVIDRPIQLRTSVWLNCEAAAE